MLLLNVKIQNYLSVSLPVSRTLDERGERVLAKTDLKSAELLAPGQACSMVADNGLGAVNPVSEGTIRSIEENSEGTIIHFTKGGSK